MVLLGHSYPKVCVAMAIILDKCLLLYTCTCTCIQVRRTAGDQLYVTLLTYDDLIPEDNTETILSLLSDTSW